MDKSKAEFEKWYFEDLKVVADYDLCWQAWQASRKALVVELPVSFPVCDDKDSAEVYFADDTRKALDAAGVAYK